MEHPLEPLWTDGGKLEMEQLMRALVSQSLESLTRTELTDMYNARYAALQNAQKW